MTIGQLIKARVAARKGRKVNGKYIERDRHRKQNKAGPKQPGMMNAPPVAVPANSWLGRAAAATNILIHLVPMSKRHESRFPERGLMEGLCLSPELHDPE